MDLSKDKNSQNLESKVGRPVHVAEYQEGDEAAQNFNEAMKSILSVPKEAILEAERAKRDPRTAT